MGMKSLAEAGEMFEDVAKTMKKAIRSMAKTEDVDVLCSANMSIEYPTAEDQIEMTEGAIKSIRLTVEVTKLPDDGGESTEITAPEVAGGLKLASEGTRVAPSSKGL